MAIALTGSNNNHCSNWVRNKFFLFSISVFVLDQLCTFQFQSLLWFLSIARETNSETHLSKVRGEGPYQALDDMNTRNPGCSTPWFYLSSSKILNKYKLKHKEGPYQALDDMNTRNPGCSTPWFYLSSSKIWNNKAMNCASVCETHLFLQTEREKLVETFKQMICNPRCQTSITLRSQKQMLLIYDLPMKRDKHMNNWTFDINISCRSGSKWESGK